MAVLSLFESSMSPMNSGRPASRRRITDLGRLSRERRLALYLGACRLLGLDPATQPLRFVRCIDGQLRLFDPTREHRTLVEAGRSAGPLARLERELSAGSSAVAGGGGVAYEIDLDTGDLRVREVIAAARVTPPADVQPPARRRGALRDMAATRTALRTAPAR